MTTFKQEEIKVDFEMRLQHGSAIEIMHGFIGIGMYLNDYNYIIDKCKELINTNDTVILRGIIFALGHLSRNLSHIDYNLAILAIQKGLFSNDTITIDAAQNLRDDLNILQV